MQKVVSFSALFIAPAFGFLFPSVASSKSGGTVRECTREKATMIQHPSRLVSNDYIIQSEAGEQI